MKLNSLLGIGLLATSLNLFANTVEQAQQLYAQRGADANNALKASAIYEELAGKEGDKVVRARLLTGASESRYFFGTKQSKVERIQEEHQKGMDLATAAGELLEKKFGEAFDGSAKTDLARAYYFYAANLGK